MRILAPSPHRQQTASHRQLHQRVHRVDHQNRSVNADKQIMRRKQRQRDTDPEKNGQAHSLIEGLNLRALHQPRDEVAGKNQPTMSAMNGVGFVISNSLAFLPKPAIY